MEPNQIRGDNKSCRPNMKVVFFVETPAHAKRDVPRNPFSALFTFVPRPRHGDESLNFVKIWVPEREPKAFQLPYLQTDKPVNKKNIIQVLSTFS